ncbi:PIG-L family deacetylase [Alloacidobacterium dinghuense]|uniref:PIG-L family deacetylase n=1 Tax=Alloacidobacterium dinghuense TaxID=2763107 RepID=A0A7G8BIP6_9BACT|nr:PIG-L family deacetylase [Alloacidobacterium dinghuense]QNI32416.1 PIG-L family deacetylase [Alloacidobacterium dinghuense]
MSYRMMCLTAHPDDESGAFGGALLMAHDKGVETSVICLTEGAAGSFRGAATSDEELAQLRRDEFCAASKLLNLTHSEILNYPDGKLDQQNFYELTGMLVEKIRKYRPQVVLTFGGDGGVNLHRDHTITSLAATAAFHWAGRGQLFSNAGKPYAPQKLYYASTPWISVYNSNEGATTARVPYSLSLELGQWKERKIEAFKMHTTQRGVLERVRDFIEKYMNDECYLLVATRSPRPLTEDQALFANVIED